MNKDFFVNKRVKIADFMTDNSLLVMFSGTAPHKSADYAYPFTPNRNFYYLTGIDKPKVVLLISKRNNKVNETLFIEKADPLLEKWEGRKLSAEEAGELSGIQDIKNQDDFYNVINKLLDANSYEKLYLNLERFEWNLEQDAAHIFSREINQRHPYLKIENIYHHIAKLRTIKAIEEQQSIRKAIDITGNAINNMMKNVKADMMENQLEAYYDFVLVSSGVREPAFPSIIAAGINAATLHYEDNNCKIEDNSLVLADVGAQYEYYCADITRTFPANGKFTERQKLLYNIVLKAQEETIKAVKPGITLTELNEITKSVLADGCKSIGLIKEDSEITKYYYHGVAHLLGLDTHDVGSREIPLESGMVLTIEPGLYVAEEKLGIRIEDDILITDNGYENLSQHIIKTVNEIEELMSER